jgi:hypothetical protein
MTGAALQALAAVGRTRGASARRAVAWLRANQNDDGGFGQFRGRSSNAQSTSYAIQGLLAADAGGRAVSRALAYLRGLQRRDGSVAYSASSAQTPVWVTAQALMALERAALPLATAPRERRPAAVSEAEESAAVPAPGPKGGGAEEGPNPEPADPPAEKEVREEELTGEQRQGLRPAGEHEDVPGEAAGVAPAPGRNAAGGERSDEAEVPAGVVAAAVAATLGLLVLFRRRLVPRRL